mgnify:CR=1 FL=1
MGNSHRQFIISIGRWCNYRPATNCRSALNDAGRQKLPAEDSFDSNRGQTAYGIGFQAHVSSVMFPIMCWTQGSMALDPRAINCAWWPEWSSLPFDVKMHAITQMRTKTLSCRRQGSRWPRIKAHYITRSMNVPWLSHLVWHPKPSNAMHAMLTRFKMQHDTNYARHAKCHATNMASMQC